MRVNCLNVTLALTALYASYLVYVYFIQHQPNAELLIAIKSKSAPQFSDALTTALAELPHHLLHFGNGRSVSAAIAMHGTPDMLRQWQAVGGDVAAASATDGRTPLHIAATFNTADFLQQLLSLLPPSHVHVRADNSYTPLLYAVLFSQHNNTRTLLDHGADPNVRLAIGGRFSACQLAAIYSDGRMMELLVEAGGIVEADEGYYGDWMLGWRRLQLRREREEAEEVERDVFWYGEEEGRGSATHQWAKHERMVRSEDAHTALSS